jgi:hypothetical protein
MNIPESDIAAKINNGTLIAIQIFPPRTTRAQAKKVKRNIGAIITSDAIKTSVGDGGGVLGVDSELKETKSAGIHSPEAGAFCAVASEAVKRTDSRTILFSMLHPKLEPYTFEVFGSPRN